jgi:hypothetical protein
MKSLIFVLSLAAMLMLAFGCSREPGSAILDTSFPEDTRKRCSPAAWMVERIGRRAAALLIGLSPTFSFRDTKHSSSQLMKRATERLAKSLIGWQIAPSRAAASRASPLDPFLGFEWVASIPLRSGLTWNAYFSGSLWMDRTKQTQRPFSASRAPPFDASSRARPRAGFRQSRFRGRGVA